jgi:hypothetical protein
MNTPQKIDRRRLTADRRKTFSSLVVRRQARDDSFENSAKCQAMIHRL